MVASLTEMLYTASVTRATTNESCAAVSKNVAGNRQSSSSYNLKSFNKKGKTDLTSQPAKALIRDNKRISNFHRFSSFERRQ